MKFLKEIYYYKLYEVEESDLDITGAAGSRYCRNTILLFEFDDEIEIGKEVASAKTPDDAELVAAALLDGSLRVSFALRTLRAQAAADVLAQTEQARLEAERGRSSTEQLDSGTKE